MHIKTHSSTKFKYDEVFSLQSSTAKAIPRCDWIKLLLKATHVNLTHSFNLQISHIADYRFYLLYIICIKLIGGGIAT
mgnify:CR=1 FL=1